MRSIKPGVTTAGITQVDGINPGDVVANSSFDKLQDNIAVVVSNPPPAAGTAANSTANSTGATTTGSSAP
jgi:multidrug efflux system membrane fusion protein